MAILHSMIIHFIYSHLFGLHFSTFPSTFQPWPSLVKKTVVSLEGHRREESVFRNDHPCCLIRPSLSSTNRGGIFWSVLRGMWIGKSFLKGVIIYYYSKTAQTSSVLPTEGTEVPPACTCVLGPQVVLGRQTMTPGTADDGSCHVRQLSKFTCYTAMFSW